MTLQEEYELSCYRVLDRLWDDKEVYLVRHVETGKLFIKKQIDLYNQRVYEHLSRLDISGVPKIYLCVEQEKKLVVIEEYIHGETLEEYKSLGKENILIYPVGKKVEQAVKKLGYTSQGSYQGMADKPSYMQAYELAALLMQEFMEKQIDRVELIYHHFKSMGSQILMREEYLPIDLSKVAATAATEGSGKRGFQNDYIVEPSVGQLIADLLPKVLSQKLFTVLQDSNASEHAARTLAMQTATDNANELIQDLTKQYNKSRQQAITNELLDIIAGSLK